MQKYADRGFAPVDIRSDARAPRRGDERPLVPSAPLALPLLDQLVLAYFRQRGGQWRPLTEVVLALGPVLLLDSHTPVQADGQPATTVLTQGCIAAIINGEQPNITCKVASPLFTPPSHRLHAAVPRDALVHSSPQIARRRAEASLQRARSGPCDPTNGSFTLRPRSPVVQITQIAAVGNAAAPPRLKMKISDGTHEVLALVTSEVASLLTSGAVNLFAAVRLTNFLFKELHVGGPAHVASTTLIVVIMGMELVEQARHKLVASSKLQSASCEFRVSTLDGSVSADSSRPA